MNTGCRCWAVLGSESPRATDSTAAPPVSVTSIATEARAVRRPFNTLPGYVVFVVGSPRSSVRQTYEARRVVGYFEDGVPESNDDIPDFRRVLRGYKISDVDRFLRDVSTRRQSGGEVPPRELLEAEFHASFVGYDVGEVDAYIADLARGLSINKGPRLHGHQPGLLRALLNTMTLNGVEVSRISS